jgi:hypothetical protein
MAVQTMTTDDEKLRRKIRASAIVLGFVAFGFFIVFLVATALKS